MQVCTSLQTDNHASTQPLRFLQAGCPSCRPTNSVKALKASRRRWGLSSIIMARTAHKRRNILKRKIFIWKSDNRPTFWWKLCKTSFTHFGGSVVDSSYKFHPRLSLSLYYRSPDGAANKKTQCCYWEWHNGNEKQYPGFITPQTPDGRSTAHFPMPMPAQQQWLVRGIRRPRLESCRGQMCLSWQPLQYTALGMGYALIAVHMSTQPCIHPGSLNWVPHLAVVRVGMSPLPGGRQHCEYSHSSEAGLHHPCKPVYGAYLPDLLRSMEIKYLLQHTWTKSRRMEIACRRQLAAGAEKICWIQDGLCHWDWRSTQRLSPLHACTVHPLCIQQTSVQSPEQFSSIHSAISSVCWTMRASQWLGGIWCQFQYK